MISWFKYKPYRYGVTGMKEKIKISVIGGSTVGKDTYDTAFEVGCLIAQRGALLVCGGMGGVMEASCKGAKSKGGITIGILPAIDEESSNPYLDIKIPTGLGYARNALVVLAGHAVIAVDGKSGTLSEIGYALTYGKPLIGLDTWELTPYFKDKGPGIIYAKDAQEAVDLAIDKAVKEMKSC